MTITQIVFIMTSAFAVFLILGGMLLVHIKKSQEEQTKFSDLIKRPEVRSAILELMRNRYHKNPTTAAHRRSNNKNALARARLKNLVDDADMRRKIYRLSNLD